MSDDKVDEGDKDDGSINATEIEFSGRNCGDGCDWWAAGGRICGGRLSHRSYEETVLKILPKRRSRR